MKIERNTLIIAAIASFLALFATAAVFLVKMSLRANDMAAIITSSLAAGISLYALAWWVHAWIAQIKRRAGKSGSQDGPWGRR